MQEEKYDYRMVEEKLKRADEVFRNVPTGTLYFYDPDDKNLDVVFRSENDGYSWTTTDGYLFSFKLDDWEFYENLSTSEALEILAERRKACDGQK